ncbi:MAG: hypothetical protein ABH829_03925 [archaeon]
MLFSALPIVFDVGEEVFKGIFGDILGGIFWTVLIGVIMGILIFAALMYFNGCWIGAILPNVACNC